MFLKYDLTVEATIAFLKTLKVKVTNRSVNDTLQNHPDWPSMLCISDSLQKWNIPNGVGRIASDDIDQLPLPFLCPFIGKDGPLVIVNQVSDTQIGYLTSQQHNLKIVGKNDFFKKWDGVYLIAEPNEASVEKNYEEKRINAAFRASIPIIFFVFLFSFSFWSIRNSFSGTINAFVYVQYFVYFIGVIITSLLLWYEIDRNNPILKRVCTGISKGDCESILASPQAKFLGWISWSEIGFIYFMGSLLSLHLATNSLNTLSWLSIFAMPYIGYSLYYQSRVIKQWCLLCLTVQVLLLVSGVSTLIGPSLKPIVPESGFLTLLVCFALPALAWFSLKPYCLKLQKAVGLKREYLRIKFNTEVFETLLRKQKTITVPENRLGISLGKVNASNSLIKVCNPYCGPCASAHPKIDKLLEQHSNNLNVRIIFTTLDSDNIISKPVKHLLAISEIHDEQVVKQALDDWYLTETKDYDAFAAKYPMNGELARQGLKLEAMSNWCKQMKVTATPTFFLNGNKLPDAYDIEDLEYFLME